MKTKLFNVLFLTLRVFLRVFRFSEREKTREDIEREGQILGEIISIIEQKDALVNMLEEDRQRCDTSRNLSSPISNPSFSRNSISNTDSLRSDSNHLMMHLGTQISSLNLDGVSSVQFENCSRPLSVDVLKSYKGHAVIYAKPLYSHKKSVLNKNLFPRFKNKRNTNFNESENFVKYFSIFPSYTFWKLSILFLFVCMFLLIVFPNILTAIFSNIEVIYRKRAF